MKLKFLNKKEFDACVEYASGSFVMCDFDHTNLVIQFFYENILQDFTKTIKTFGVETEHYTIER